MQFQRRLNKVGRHSTRGEIPELAAAQLRRFVFRVFRDQCGEIFAASQTNGKRFDRGSFGLDNLGGSLRRRGQEQMADAKALGNKEILRMRLIEPATFVFGDVDLARDPI